MGPSTEQDTISPVVNQDVSAPVYGCGKSLLMIRYQVTYLKESEHLEKFLGNEAVAGRSARNYLQIQNKILHLKKTSLQSLTSLQSVNYGVSVTLRPVFMCLQCSETGEPKERDHHGREREHRFCEWLLSGS